MGNSPLKPGVYIATKNNQQQVVTISINYSKKCCFSGDYIYECDYGVISSHETFCNSKQLRELTVEEQAIYNEKGLMGLPQQFYQSGAPGMPSMDAKN
tara:strand:- start:121 stop:414 length:294 start_codon:yes stop_codon:yes gene_type:complete